MAEARSSWNSRMVREVVCSLSVLAVLSVMLAVAAYRRFGGPIWPPTQTVKDSRPAARRSGQSPTRAEHLADPASLPAASVSARAAADAGGRFPAARRSTATPASSASQAPQPAIRLAPGATVPPALKQAYRSASAAEKPDDFAPAAYLPSPLSLSSGPSADLPVSRKQLAPDTPDQRDLPATPTTQQKVRQAVVETATATPLPTPAASVQPASGVGQTDAAGPAILTERTVFPPVAAAAPVAAQQPAGHAVGKRQLQAQPGDSFWTISQRAYGSGCYFRALYEYNRDRFPDFNHLPVGQMVDIPELAELRRRYSQLCGPAGETSPQQQPAGPAPPPQLNQLRTYVVQPGETLFDIARYQLGQASRYVEILKLNRDRLPDATAPLVPGTRLKLPSP